MSHDRASHQTAADSLRPQPVPPDRVYQLWFLAPGTTAPRSLGLLPQSTRKRIAITSENARLLAAGGSPDPVQAGQRCFGERLEAPGECVGSLKEGKE